MELFQQNPPISTLLIYYFIILYKGVFRPHIKPIQNTTVYMNIEKAPLQTKADEFHLKRKHTFLTLDLEVNRVLS